MSQKGNYDNLLIDFNNLNVGDIKQSPTKPTSCNQNNATTKTTTESMALLCSSQPLYKLLSSEPSDVDDNNPFDHLDKRACLSDDPFEIVENAALVPSAEAELPEVETGTLISIESPIVSTSDLGFDIHSKQGPCETPKSANSANEIKFHDFFQNASQSQTSNSKNLSPKLLASSSGKNRAKVKSTSLTLLKYSLSNNRLDLMLENGSHSDEQFSLDETLQEKQKSEINIRRDTSTDDSFDDIWATKPNLIDSQTDIELESDIDNDIAKLNIPMLNISATESNPSGKEAIIFEQDPVDLVETKLINRSEILEKLASIKQKIPASPMHSDSETILTHNRTVEIKCSQVPYINSEDEPVTPKSQYSSVLLPQPSIDNTNSLIENLKKLVDQCDDKSKQTTAKHLLDDLSSILTATNNRGENGEQSTISTELRPPALIKRQGTFSIEKDIGDGSAEDKSIDEKCSKENIRSDKEVNSIDQGLSEVMKQIQNAFGPHQNINVLQTNVQSIESSTAPVVNPTYIVVMTQPVTDFGENEEIQRSHRGRSQSLTLKERPLAVNRAVQQKNEQSRAQTAIISTPINRPTLQRRSSFGTIIRKQSKNNVNESQNLKQSIVPSKPDDPKVMRRASLQPTNEIELIQAQPLNPVTRRKSFQGPSSTTSGLRSPSPKPNFNSNLLRGQPPPLRLSTTGTLTRRKSFANDLVAKDSPQKLKTSSYGIIKKPPAPPAARNLKIRVTQTMNSRSTAPLRAVVPMNRVASSVLVNESISSVENNNINAIITSTPRSIPSLSPAKSIKGSSKGPSSTPPAASPIQTLQKDRTYLSMTPPKSVQAYSNVPNRRRTLSDYRTEVNNSVTVDSNSSGKTVSSIKNATKTLASGLSKFTSKRMSNIGLKRLSTGSKENKQPLS